jgi:ectoine hydroxylase-related dioxygenase (phytanoyl-CoA dioxygenase family)
MGAWVALDDVDSTNGALIAVKGSHNLPEADLMELKNRFFPNSDVPPSSTPLFNAYNDALVEAANKAGLPVVECIVKKGDLIIWNPATLHGGLPHIDKTRTRRSFVMHITPKNMPMRHMDYFFHRDRPIVGPDEKIYFNYLGRDIVAGSDVDFRHVKKISIKKLGIF